MKRLAGASYARFRKMVRRRAEGLRSPEAPRIALVWPAAPGATCRAPGKEGGGLAAARGASPVGYVGHRGSSRPHARSTCRIIFSKIVLASPSEFPYSTTSHGGVAQLGERLTGSQEVRGSIPLVSTRALNEAPTQVGAFFHIYRFMPCVGWVASWRHTHC